LMKSGDLPVFRRAGTVRVRAADLARFIEANIRGELQNE
jgi:hypothetical protein